jgi:hypothetical protein
MSFTTRTEFTTRNAELLKNLANDEKKRKKGRYVPGPDGDGQFVTVRGATERQAVEAAREREAALGAAGADFGKQHPSGWVASRSGFALGVPVDPHLANPSLSKSIRGGRRSKKRRSRSYKKKSRKLRRIRKTRSYKKNSKKLRRTRRRRR